MGKYSVTNFVERMYNFSYVIIMTKSQPPQNLVDIFPRNFRLKTFRLALHLVEKGVVNKFKDQVKMLPSTKYFQEIDQVFVA